MSVVAVTGATGFVGHHLVEHLRTMGTDVISLSRRGSLHERCVHFDLEAPEALAASALQGIDCLFHLAARVHVMRQSPKDALQFHLLNVHATETLARRAAAAGVRRFVFVSSIKVNGERTTQRPFTVADTPAPQDAYGQSKLAAENVLHQVAHDTGLQVVIVRPPLIYGPGVGANFKRLVTLANSGIPLPFAAIHNRRSLVNVWNLVSLLECLSQHPRAHTQNWFVSDGNDVSTSELLQSICSATHRRARLWPMPSRVLNALGKLSGMSAEIGRLVDSLQVDISATRSQLEWTPLMPMEQAMAKTMNAFCGERRAVA